MLVVCVVPLKLVVHVFFMILIDVVLVLLITIYIGGVEFMNTLLFCLWISRKIIFLGGMDTRVVVKVGLTISRLSFVYHGPCTQKLL